MIVMPFSRSRSIESSMRSGTASFARKSPDCQSIASTSVVFPWSTWAMIAMLRMSARCCIVPSYHTHRRAAVRGYNAVVSRLPRRVSHDPDPRRQHPDDAPRRRPGAGRRPTERADEREGDRRHLHGEGRRDHHRALPRRRTQDRRQLRPAGQEGLLQQTDLPPGRAGLRRPGRRPQGQRHRGTGVHDQGRVQRAQARARHGGDGALDRPRLGGQPVLHLPRPGLLPRREVHGLRPRDQGDGRRRRDPDRRPDEVGEDRRAVGGGAVAWSLLIQNGLVIDGSGAPAVRADVAVEGGRVAAVDAGLRGPAERTIDATGHYVTPGFIDIHSHSDLFYLACPAAESKVRQGCTTEVVGMCSFSPAPVHPARKETVRAWAGGIGARLEVEWETFGQYLDVLRAARPSINVVHMVGHGALRLAAPGPDDRAVTPDDLRAMDRVLRLIDTARARGLDVTGDVYPYNAGSTKMDNLLPPWMHDGGVSKLLARLADRPTRRRVVEECLIDGERWRTPMGSIGFDQIFVATCSRPELEGLTLAHLGRATGGTPAEAMLSLVAEERAGVPMVVFSQSEEHVAKVLAHPAVMIGAVSLGLAAGPAPHPGKT